MDNLTPTQQATLDEMGMAEKIAIAFDDQAREILENIYPELRNAAVNIAVKMLARDPIYKKYFCIKWF